MEYRIIRTGEEPDSFEHALFGGGRQKGVQNKNHKYLARAWWKNKWRYAYTEAEVRALQMLGKGKNGGLADQKKLNDAKRNAYDAKKQMEKTDKAMAKSVNKTVNNVVDKAKGTANVASGQAKKAADQVSNAVQKTAYNVKNSAAKTASNAQKSAKEFVSDVKSGITAKQLSTKAKTAVDNLKEDAPKVAKSVANTAKETAKKASETASGVAKSAQKTAENAVKSAKKSVEDLKNYKDNVDAKKELAEDRSKKFLNQHLKRQNDEDRTWANRWEKQRAVVKEAEKEQKSTKYKMSDLMSNGKDSDTYKEGKKKVDDFINRKKEDLKYDLNKAKKSIEKGKAKVNELVNKSKSAAAKAYDKVTDDIEKVRESDAMAYVNKATDKVRDAAERVADKASDAKANAQHKLYANEMKRKYGADSLHYKDAQAYVEHDKTVDDLRKARDKYGVNSSEYKVAAARERSARERMDDAHEQNLYANNNQYKNLSDEASALGRYINSVDARGGPKTDAGKRNYQDAMRELQRLEAQLERLWNEDWE